MTARGERTVSSRAEGAMSSTIMPTTMVGDGACPPPTVCEIAASVVVMADVTDPRATNSPRAER